MKVIKPETVLSKPVGERASVKLVLEDADDVWTLYNLLDVDDEVRAPTTRKVAADASGTTSSTEKRRVVLTLRATKVEYDGVNASVRVSGQNVEAHSLVSLGAYHTTEIASRFEVTVTKSSWDAGHRDALTAKKRGGEVAAVLASEARDLSARLYALSGSLSRHLGSVDVHKSKSEIGRDKARDKFVQQLRRLLADKVDWQTCRCIALCGPGANDLLLEVAESSKANKKADASAEDPVARAFRDKKVVAVEHASGGVSMEALEALLSESSVARLVADTSLAAHFAALEDFREAEARDPDRVTYGSVRAAREAADRAAIAKLLVLDERLKNARDVAERRAVADLIQTAKDLGGKNVHVLVFPKNHVTAQRLRNLGGVAAILRFPCPDLAEMTDAPPVAVAPVATEDDAASVATTCFATPVVAKHVEIKQKAPTTAAAKKKQQQSSSRSQTTKKKPPKPKLAADDDYCDDDYYDY
mmetsp:Transcript_23805/g.73256  ORF Transcript_23805/g.73256 Transcript_23805/m.73256 type:complete len:473 (+) Transcript_23805:119-1537(+)